MSECTLTRSGVITFAVHYHSRGKDGTKALLEEVALYPQFHSSQRKRHDLRMAESSATAGVCLRRQAIRGDIFLGVGIRHVLPPDLQS